MKSATPKIVYAYDKSFSIPRWFSKRVTKAIHSIGLATGNRRYRTSMGDFYALAREVGVYVDHVGRLGKSLCIEPYADNVKPEKIAEFADLLDCEFEIRSDSQWNPDGIGPTGTPTILVTFSERTT